MSAGQRGSAPAFVGALVGAALLVAGGPISGLGARETPDYDILIRGGRILDGTGSEPFNADIAIRDDRIVAVGRLWPADAGLVLDARGLWVAPGFIDTHSHAGGGLTTPELSHARPLLAQGITTIVANPDGGGPVDLEAQRLDLLKNGLGVNVAQMVSHGSIRSEVMGMADRAPTPVELDSMRVLVRRAMEAGAVGLSSGPFYAPGSYSETEELVALARVAAEHGGRVYQSHVRDESDYTIGLLAALEEVITVARESGLIGIHTHIKALGPPVWGASEEIVRRVERAREEGVEVYADQYPYLASATGLGAALVPRWVQAGGRDSMVVRFRRPDLRPRILEEMAENLARRGGADRIQFRRYRPDPSIEGRTLDDLARERGQDPLEVAIDLLEEESVSIVSFNMSEEDVRTLMRQPWTMTASDGGLVSWGVGVPHPRSYGAFPRKIRTYVLEEGVVELPEAIRSMTSLPAEVFGLEGRGVIREGAVADLVVFDLEEVRDVGTFTDPHHLAEGMMHVLVNGRRAVLGGSFLPRRWGRVLSRGR